MATDLKLFWCASITTVEVHWAKGYGIADVETGIPE